MRKFEQNEQYMSIAIYAFIVLALSILAIVIGLNLGYIWAELGRFLNSLAPIFFGFSLAYICNPLVRFSERMILRRLKKRSVRLARLLALGLTYFFVLLVIFILVLMIVPQIVLNYNDFAHNISEYIRIIVEAVDVWIRDTGIFGQDYSSIGELIRADEISGLLNEWATLLAQYIGLFSLQILESIGYIMLGAVFSAYFLFHKEIILATAKKITLSLVPHKVYRFFADTLSFADRAFGQFIVGKLFDSLLVGVIAFIVFAIAGIPYYPLISAIVCVTSVIPAFGYIIGAIPAVFIIFVKDPMMALWFLILLLIIQQIDGNIIGPKIVGSATGLASVWVITAIMLFGAYLGPIGWFIGVPLFSVIYRLVGDIANRALTKKNLPTDIACYRAGDPIPQKAVSTSGKEDSHEKVDE